MSANIPIRGKPRQLDKPAEAAAPIVEKDVQDPTRLVRLILDILRDLRNVTRRWLPHRLDFEDREVDDTGTTKYRLEHKFDAPVRWWLVDWTGDAAPNLRRHAESDANTLVLTSTSEGTATIRVEQAG